MDSTHLCFKCVCMHVCVYVCVCVCMCVCVCVGESETSTTGMHS